jgi:hypothetical protein
MRGDEAAWWAQHAIDPIQVAQGLWQRSHAGGVLPSADEGSQTPSEPDGHVGGAPSR